MTIMPTMPTSRPYRAIVIGGSLGGLFTAICLRAIGWNVDVFERSPQQLDSRGGGLVLQPGVLDALDFAGVAHPPEFGVPSKDRIFLDREGVVRRIYMPQTQIAWNGLYALMKGALDPGMIHAGEELVALAHEADHMTARFASGRTERADLLIGADGPLSTVRQALLPGDAPAYAGYVAWRGVLPEAALGTQAKSLLVDAFAFQDGPGHQMLTYLIPGEDGSVLRNERRLNWVWHRALPAGGPLAAVLLDRHGRQHTHSLPPGAVKDADARALRHDAADSLAPVFAALVASTPDPFLQLIQDYAAPRMRFGRAVLLGDAAFVARPHTGAGAGKAAANAVALARALQATGNRIDDALALWDRSQWAADKRLAQWGIALGRRIMGVVQPA
ncbi:FAD binding domain-containing protein [Cupriavidus sp. 8B]